MNGIDIPVDKNVLVDTSSADDAGVFLLNNNTALVQTLDFITPISDDPYTFGRIAAANSLSDIYAMGGLPLTALNIVCFPTKKFSLQILKEILSGGLSVINESGARLLGGHTVDDSELKYGLSVTGTIDPEKIIRNTGMKEGDAIILTKPLGTGIIATALKAGIADEKILGPFTESMTRLNSILPVLASAFKINACTDVTGFGLAGHLKEMIGNEDYVVEIYSKNLPVLPGALENAEMGTIPGGLYRNRDFVGELLDKEEEVEQAMHDIILDPQTSGGLLIAISEKDSEKALKEIHSLGFKDASIIARVKKNKRPGLILKNY